MIAHTNIAAPTYLNIDNIKFIKFIIVLLASGAVAVSAANAGIMNMPVPIIIDRKLMVICFVFSNPPANLGCFGWKSAVNFLFCIDFFFIVNTLSVFCSYRTIFVL